MLNFLRDDLLQYNDVIIIDFNARASANVNCIQSDFLSIIATQLSQYHTGMKSVVKDYMGGFERIGTRYDMVKSFRHHSYQ